jgi:hypothetical protein
MVGWNSTLRRVEELAEKVGARGAVEFFAPILQLFYGLTNTQPPSGL